MFLTEGSFLIAFCDLEFAILGLFIDDIASWCILLYGGLFDTCTEVYEYTNYCIPIYFYIFRRCDIFVSTCINPTLSNKSLITYKLNKDEINSIFNGVFLPTAIVCARAVS